MNNKQLKGLIAAAVVILAVCLGLTVAMHLRTARPQETGPKGDTSSTPGQDTVATQSQDATQTQTPAETEEDLLPLDTSDGLEVTKPAETTGSQKNPDPAPDAPTQPSNTATEPSGESPTQTPTEEPTEEPTEGTLPPNLLPIG